MGSCFRLSRGRLLRCRRGPLLGGRRRLLGHGRRGRLGHASGLGVADHLGLVDDRGGLQKGQLGFLMMMKDKKNKYLRQGPCAAW